MCDEPQPCAALLLGSRRDQAPRARRGRCHARGGVRVRRARRGLPGLAPRRRPRGAHRRRRDPALARRPGRDRRRGARAGHWSPTRRARSRSRRPRASSGSRRPARWSRSARGALGSGSKRTSSRAAWPSWRPAPSRRSCGPPSLTHCAASARRSRRPAGGRRVRTGGPDTAGLPATGARRVIVAAARTDPRPPSGGFARGSAAPVRPVGARRPIHAHVVCGTCGWAGNVSTDRGQDANRTDTGAATESRCQLGNHNPALANRPGASGILAAGSIEKELRAAIPDTLERLRTRSRQRPPADERGTGHGRPA